MSTKGFAKFSYQEVCKLMSNTHTTNALAERIKELNCLYGISNLLENEDATLGWILSHAVNLIPA